MTIIKYLKNLEEEKYFQTKLLHISPCDMTNNIWNLSTKQI